MRRLLHREARERGYASPDHLIEDLTLAQLVELLAFARLEPAGQERATYGEGAIWARLGNLYRESGRPDQPRDLMPREQKAADWAAVQAGFRAQAQAQEKGD